MGDTPLTRLFTNRNSVKSGCPADGQMPSPSWTTPLMSEEVWDYLLGPEERPIVIFPIQPPEIQAILPKVGTTHEAIMVEEEAL